MKTVGLVIGLAASLACGAANATVFAYNVVLNGANEAPMNASPGTGYARVTINDITWTLDVDASFRDLIGLTTAAHIHAATAIPFTGVSRVATEVPSFPHFPTGVTHGAFQEHYDLTLLSSYNPAFANANGGTALSAAGALLQAAQTGRAYLNIHTRAFPAGEIRGFLTPVPETSSWALMIAGFATMGAFMRLRHRSAAVSAV